MIGINRAIKAYSLISDYKDSRQRMDELINRGENIITERNKKIKKTIVKTVKGTRTTFKIVALLTNLLFTTALAMISILTWTEKEYPIITAIFITISTLVSVPGIGQLIFKNKYKLLQKVLRWAIVVLLFLIGFAFCV